MTLSRSNRRLLYAAVLFSLLMFWGFAWFMGGLDATPWDTKDSQGRTMGFNDVFSAEHHGVILQNAGWSQTVKHLTRDDFWFHHWALIAAHAVLLFLLAKAKAATVLKFICCQLVIFFWGWIGFWALPLGIVGLLWGYTSDREGFTDIPFLAIMSQGAWFLACGFILLVMKISRLRQTIGLRNVQEHGGATSFDLR